MNCEKALFFYKNDKSLQLAGEALTVSVNFFSEI